MRVGLYLGEVNARGLSGGGGAERFFINLIRSYQEHNKKDVKLYLCLNSKTKDSLRRVGILKHIPELRMIVLPVLHNRFSTDIESIAFLLFSLYRRIDLIHCINFNHREKKVLSRVTKVLPLTITVVDCQASYQIEKDFESGGNNAIKRYITNAAEIGVNGVLTWYQRFKEKSLSDSWYPNDVIVDTTSCRYMSTRKSLNSKKRKLIIWAGRLDSQKRPILFLESIRLIKSHIRDHGYKVRMFGLGPLEEVVKEKLISFDISDIVELGFTPDLTGEFTKSRFYVSTQQFDNFPSLGMMEAMAAGNVILAFNVGRTSGLMVKHEENGFLAANEDSQTMSELLLRAILLKPKLFKRMSKSSKDHISSYHTFERFSAEIEDFWDRVLQKSDGTEN